MPVNGVHGIGFVGVRIDDHTRFASAVSLYADVFGMAPFRAEPHWLAWFRLGDGTELHVH